MKQVGYRPSFAGAVEALASMVAKLSLLWVQQPFYWHLTQGTIF